MSRREGLFLETGLFEYQFFLLNFPIVNFVGVLKHFLNMFRLFIRVIQYKILQKLLGMRNLARDGNLCLLLRKNVFYYYCIYRIDGEIIPLRVTVLE